MKTKHFFLSLVLILSFQTISQTKTVEEFYINQNVGFIEIESLKEIMPPFFYQHSKLKFNTNYFGYIKNDTLFAIHKYTQKWIEPVPYKTKFKMDYQNFILKYSPNVNTYIVLDSLLNKVSTFPAHYGFINQFEIGSNFFYSVSDTSRYDFLTVFKKDDLNFKIVAKNLPATKFTKVNTSRFKGYAFYGYKQTYLYDKNFKLIHTTNQSFHSPYQVHDYFEYIDKVKEPGLYGFQGPTRKPKVTPNDHYLEIEANEKTRIYEAQALPLRLSINENYIIKNSYGKIIVYKLERKENSVQYGSKNSFWFYIDSNRKAPLIPTKYIQNLNLQIESK